MADRLPERDTSSIPTKNMGQQIDAMQRMAEDQRKNYSRHWYDNNFFDDGHHFRFISRTTGRITDLSTKASIYSPKRAIPKASRQIRGMANLMLSSDFVPTIYPEKVSHVNYPNPEEYKEAMQRSKLIAQKVGHWIKEDWERVQELDIKLAFMMLLTMKHYISFMQIWPDPVEERIKTQVYDAFDIYLLGNYTDIEDCPFIGKIIPKTVKEIKANEHFDKDQLLKISPDNRYASDEVKEAYLASKFGRQGNPSDASATLLLKEFFIKEYLNDENIPQIRKSEQGKDILAEKKKGDMVIRQIFSAGGVWLRDQYVNLPGYPFVDLRLEPGKIYGTAQIERFIPANKSLDSIMSRMEKFIHTMNVGVWLKRRGENFKINNVSGGLVAEYDGMPPQQMNLATIPAHVFNFIGLLESFIEEQGVTTSALGKVPKGVKAWGAIESLKASEFANLFIPIKMLKKTVRNITEKMLWIADRHFVKPQDVELLDKGEPNYFQIMGQKGIDVRRDELQEQVDQNIIPIKKDYKVKIEVEQGLGYTEEGKKGRMMEISQFFLEMAKTGLLTPDAVKIIVQRLVEIFKFGPTADLMEALENIQPDNDEMTPEKKDEMKEMMLQVLIDYDKAKGQAEQQEEQQKGTRETTRSETIEEGKDGKKTKSEVKLVEKG